jgi:hypothetical protein
MTFEIPLLNPFRFVNINAVINPRYNTLPFDLQNDVNNPNGPYIQKWQTNDTAKIQILSDYTPGEGEGQNNLSLDFYKCTGEFYLNVPLNPIALTITGETFTAYEAEVDFGDFDPGLYVGEISYVDENENEQIWQTSKMDVQVLHNKTQLIEYCNSVNDKAVVFDTGIVFNFRIESIIREYTPKSLSQDYIDQEYNNYSLNDIPYRTFKYYIGTAAGLPGWVIDKMNLIFSLNTIQIDGTYYNKVSGQEFELTRPSGAVNDDGFMSIDIIPTNNFNLSKFDTSNLPTGDYKVIRDDIHYPNNSADIVIAGKFKTYTNLVGIYIINNNLELGPFDVTVGTTGAGSQDITKIHVPATETSVHFINKYFKTAKTVYLSGLAGSSCDIYIIFDQLDASVISTPPTESKIPIGTLCWYYEVNPGDFELDWNIADGTGLRDYAGCVLVGTNDIGDGSAEGIPNLVGKSLEVWDRAQPTERQTETGSDEISLTKSNMPNDLIPILKGAPGPKPAFGSGVAGIWVTYDPSPIVNPNKNIGTPIQLDPLNTDPQVPIQNKPPRVRLAAYVRVA